MAIVELSRYEIAEEESRLEPFDFSAATGDCLLLTSDSRRTASLLFRGLATLTLPVSGTYRFTGRLLDFSRHQNTLWYKKHIGFISPFMTLLSNRTLLENLLLPRCYAENTLSAVPDEELRRLCGLFSLTRELHQRVADTNRWEVRMATAIRELAKMPAILLVERPEEVVSPDRMGTFLEILHNRCAAGTPLLLFSLEEKIIDKFFPSQRIRITDNKLTCP